MKNDDGQNSRDAGILSSPLSFLRSGYFYWYYAGLGNRGGGGSYWSLRSVSTTGSSGLGFYNTVLYPQNYNNRGYGFAVLKSFTTLINTSYSIKNEGDERDSGVLSAPLSFLRSGYSGWNYAGLYSRGGSGLYWSLRSVSTTNSNVLFFYNTYLNPQSSDYRGNGFAVRCVSFS